MSPAQPNFTLIKAARLIDGRGGDVVANGALLVEGAKIRGAGPAASVRAPEGASVATIDYGDRTLLPGLIDAHVHLNGFGDGRSGDDLATLPDGVLTLQSARNARAHLYTGVTTVRDCGAKDQTTFMLRKAVEMGVTPAPRLALTGRPMSIVGGHLHYFGIEATGPDGCRSAVRQLIKEGADFIKITATGGSTATSKIYKPSFNVD
ncbi:MAG: amidohydrolase family protein [SAR202 cluster bacterium]|nr:amidohydrolase family protein [SAR202 cluster bacterium]